MTVKAVDIGNALMDAPHKEPMSKELSAIMLTLLMAEFTTPDSDSVLAKTEGAPLGFQIIQQRAEVHGVDATSAAKLFMSAVADRPGNCILYLAALKALSVKLGGKKVTVSDIAQHGFPLGFPTDDEMQRVWESQKKLDGKGSDNWLDYSEAWQ